MQIAGIQKMTLVDYPGKVAATVFTRGCSFRCGFCHNPELVLPKEFNPLIPEEDFFRFLESRLGKIEAICITGGEPTIQNDIGKFISHIKALGFLVKLDSNGSMPEVLEEIIEEGDVDYIAMDIKAPLSKYQAVSNSNLKILKNQDTTEDILKKNIKRSINLIMNSGIDYEFRTTVNHPHHRPEDFKGIGELINGAKRYFIQNFVPSKQIDSKIKFKPFTRKELEESLKIIKKYINDSNIR